MSTALLIVDIQNDFFESGPLPVEGSTAVIPIINKLRENPIFDHVFLTCDWHPINHISFAANHTNPTAEPYTEIMPNKNEWVAFTKDVPSFEFKPVRVWPVHCVCYTEGAAFHPKLNRKPTDIIIEKGKRVDTDSFSGFGSFPEDTGLHKMLTDLNVKTVYVVGLCADICSGATALDAQRLAYETFFVLDGSIAAIPEEGEKMVASLKELGVKVLNSNEVK
uniref:nicotinamidase n=1 Tax=Cardiosporidium cionae TaxID=476202 RepID=A0A3Q8UBH6_9APIC|nr:peroxisomal adenine nucleotide carrier 1 [Cardiosporidium cionae]